MAYQVSIDRDGHLFNMASSGEQKPVCVLICVLPDGTEGWRLKAHQVRFLGPAWTEYGWGIERAHDRGARFGAHIWICTDGAVEYRDEHHVWHRAD